MKNLGYAELWYRRFNVACEFTGVTVSTIKLDSTKKANGKIKNLLNLFIFNVMGLIE
jgi:hypothetical protein